MVEATIEKGDGSGKSLLVVRYGPTVDRTGLKRHLGDLSTPGFGPLATTALIPQPLTSPKQHPKGGNE